MKNNYITFQDWLTNKPDNEIKKRYDELSSLSDDEIDELQRNLLTDLGSVLCNILKKETGDPMITQMIEEIRNDPFLKSEIIKVESCLYLELQVEYRKHLFNILQPMNTMTDIGPNVEVNSY